MKRTNWCATAAEVEGLRQLRAALKAAMLSRPRRTVMQDLWIRADRKASRALAEPVRLADVAKARQKVLRLIEAMRLDAYEASARRAA
jgi:hypothetical protein